MNMTPALPMQAPAWEPIRDTATNKVVFEIDRRRMLLRVQKPWGVALVDLLAVLTCPEIQTIDNVEQ